MEFCASGKILLFGEYLVLKGSQCLAIPLQYGQKAIITVNNTNQHTWKSFERGKEWFTCKFDHTLALINSTNIEKATIIQKLLLFIFEGNPAIFRGGLDFNIHSDFPKEWGFGSSSSLISILSQWGSYDPYLLLARSFGGSGYDIACATAITPLLYRAQPRSVEPVSLSHVITGQLLFIYSGRKQSSQAEVSRFSSMEVTKSVIERINKIISEVLRATAIEDFEACIIKSEILVSDVTHLERIQNQLFPDYPYAIKSLGAWGGDFFMATFRDKKVAECYFNRKGYTTCFTYSQLIYNLNA